VLGAILLVFVLLVPRGMAPMVTERLVRWLPALRRPARVTHELAQKGKV